MRTALYDRHVKNGGKIVEFSGWEMPVQYKGIIPEHTAVREKVGLFDVSHMGRVEIKGKDAEKFLDFLSTNRIAGKGNQTATYTVWPNENGGCVDDVIVYRQDHDHFFVIVNAGNRKKDLEHLQKYAKDYDVHIQDHFEDEGILALQGPNAEALLAPLFMEVTHLKNMHFVPLHYHGKHIIISKTGYTGAGGFEIYAPIDLIVELWDWFINEGDAFGLEPAGLGARDTLRLEMGYALYGHEINETISAHESVSAWTIKWDKDFLGKKVMERNQDHRRREYGVLLTEPGIAREGYEVYQDETLIGKVTSGNYAPTLDRAIAIILVNNPLKQNDVVEIKIRQKMVKAKVVPLPFIKS